MFFVVVEVATEGGAAEDGLDELVLAEGFGEVVLFGCGSVFGCGEGLVRCYVRPFGLRDISRGRRPLRGR